jgi:hypothetical protein
MKWNALVGVVLLSGCIDFDAKFDAGRLAEDGSVQLDASVLPGDGGDCPGFTTGEGFCWVNPTPMGEDLNAILYRGEDDVWVGGEAAMLMHGHRVGDGGFQWASFQQRAWLSRTTDFSGRVNSILGLPDGSVMALGEALPLLTWNGSTWTPLQPSPNFVAGAAYDPRTGVVRGVGADDAYLDVSPEGAVSGSSLGDGQAWSVVPHPNGFVTGVTLRATNQYVLTGGITTPLTGLVANDAYDRVTLWNDPDETRVWAAARDCKVGVVTPPSSAQYGDRCAAIPGVRPPWLAGRWSPALQRHVLVGGFGMIMEATEAQLLGTAAVVPTALNDVGIPGVEHNFTALDFTADGGVLTVGTGAYIVERRAGDWRAHAVRFRSRLGTVLPLPDGGTLILGDDALVLSPSTTGDESPLRPFNPGTHLFAGWHDGARLWAIRDNEVVNEQDETLVATRTIDFAGTGISGHAGADLAVVGERGEHLFVDDAGLALRGQLDASIDLTGITATPEGFIVGSAGLAVDGGRIGQLFSFTNGGIVPVAPATDFGLFALTTSEGVLYAVGENGRGLRWALDGGATQLQTLPCVGCRTTTLRAVAARSASDVWAVGNGGVAYHWDGTRWTDIETGTRQNLAAVGFSGDGRWLWLAGDYGVVLRKLLR